LYTSDLTNPAQLSNLLATYPHTTMVSNQEHILTLRRAGLEICDVELSTAVEIESSSLASWTNTDALILPPLWQAKHSYRLTISQGDDYDDFTAFGHMNEAWEGRLGIFKEHITELNVAFPVQIAAFAPCYDLARTIPDNGHLRPAPWFSKSLTSTQLS
jgi:hypothetical protein